MKLWSITVLLLLIFLAVISLGFAYTDGSIRLVGGTSNLEGRVEVCSGGSWGTVCDDFWGISDATVVCRQLGYEPISALGSAYFGQGNGSIVLDDVQCVGSESYLTNCTHTINHNCTHSEDAGVRCALCTTGSIRLVNGSHDWEGRVEVCHSGSWGTVCADYWGYLDAAVVCRQLGWGTSGTYRSSAYFGQGTGSILLSDVQCTGTEQFLTNCTHLSNRNCRHSEDAGVTCHVCSSGALRLVGGSNSSEGRVELCLNGRWGTVCDDSWDNTDAGVVCRQLGLGTTGTAHSSAYFGLGIGSILLDDVACDGTEQFLANCTHTFCDAYWDSTDAGVVCRQLGYGSGTAFGSAHFAQESGALVMDNVRCDGTESHLTNCTHLTVDKCFPPTDAGVRCARK
ncbi:PREDICTED: deleted in malignant brain tumors 1 protein-like [Amphimedon queenslandica]|uniref:SRCR domain-containing protein n=1 Tax=Amphimedon queenslandica TaxID=400682 RepID=A0AAN0JFM2_AMPQE|nr:PREDICTED: deleted in malignant brain tumors 1 protein-like [Amphimedon queenslandica]|eukprot:XP_019855587.1 PREDICTED: deleted in malignant brain tumors 1 protein-like [Amphimedon queenslandica]